MNPTLRRDADAIIRSSLNAVLPDEAVRRALKAFAPRGGRVLLVAAGKAAWQMAHAAVEALGRVDGAVGMVEMALDRLSENKVVELDDERKAAMVSNLLVVLCGNRDAQPIVNSGSLY